jgi:hypothetical protein
VAQFAEGNNPGFFPDRILRREFVLNGLRDKLSQGNSALSRNRLGAPKNGIGNFQRGLHF